MKYFGVHELLYVLRCSLLLAFGALAEPVAVFWIFSHTKDSHTSFCLIISSCRTIFWKIHRQLEQIIGYFKDEPSWNDSIFSSSFEENSWRRWRRFFGWRSFHRTRQSFESNRFSGSWINSGILPAVVYKISYLKDTWDSSSIALHSFLWFDVMSQRSCSCSHQFCVVSWWKLWFVSSSSSTTAALIPTQRFSKMCNWLHRAASCVDARTRLDTPLSHHSAKWNHFAVCSSLITLKSPKRNTHQASRCWAGPLLQCML